MRRARKRKGDEAQRVKHPTPSRVIDDHIGDEEQKKTKLEENLRAMVGHFVQVCRRRCLKANGSKRKVIVLGGVCFGRIRY